MSKVVRETRREITDTETGEIKKVETCQVFSINKEPPYVKMYINDLGAILGLPDNARSLLYLMAHSMDYEGIVTVNKSRIKRFMNALGCTEKTVRNNLSVLKKSQAIKIVDTGEYELNPNYFAKGDWRETMKRQKDFALTITYTKDGKRAIKGKSI